MTSIQKFTHKPEAIETAKKMIGWKTKVKRQDTLIVDEENNSYTVEQRYYIECNKKLR